MYIVDESLSISCNYPLSLLHPQQKILFFDIETTGLSPLTSSFYLIGCLYPTNSDWRIRQWFCERMEDEVAILHEFFSFLSNFKLLIHFNGDTFDIPYLTQCAKQYHITPTFDQIQSVDLLRKIRPYKKLLHLTSLKQISLEHFLHIDREDCCSGKELIPIYQQYLKNHSEQLLQLLLLHNHDDLKGMSQLLPLLTYEKLFSSPSLMQCKCISVNDQFICVHAIHSVPLPNLLRANAEWGKVEIDGKDITFQIVFFSGERKYFYSDYKNYYYLPLEDMAIHKKVAQFVDSEHKKKATASTAYTRQSGRFLPLGENQKAFSRQTGCESIAVFRDAYKGKQGWILFEEAPKILTSYTQFLLAHLVETI